MNFKYYDILTQIIAGCLILVTFLFTFGFSYDNDYTIPYLAGAFIIGYFINIASSLLEGFYYWTIGGKPSNKILCINPHKEYSGISKVRFYHTVQVVTMLKNDLDDCNAKEGKMFGYAMIFSNGDEKSRVPDFNARYAFSRVMLTIMLIISIILFCHFYDKWEVYLVLIPLLLSWNRYREQGYYYAREVLNEYIKKKKTS